MFTAELIDSVGSGNLSSAVVYLEKGGNPNTLSNDGATAMHIAAGVGVEAVRLLLAYGGNPNVRSVDGSTPLHVAAAWGDKETVRLLLHNGADPNTLDQDGQSAVEVAKNEGHAACVDFLRYYRMLAAVGDEEESPMYTSELVYSGQGDISSAVASPRPMNPASIISHQQAHQYPVTYSSDEEDPVNLSAQYTEALERRLGRLLSDGKKVCLDVTSPDCPCIRDKCDQKRRDRRTILAEGSCSHLPSPCDSDESENNFGFICAKSSCHCYGGHCCVPEESKQSPSHRPRVSFKSYEHHCLERPQSPDYFDPEMNYARNIEQRMRQKYFPDLDYAGVSKYQCGPTEKLSTPYKHSFFRNLSPDRTRDSNTGIRSVSPCAHSSVNCPQFASQRCMSPSPNRARSERSAHSNIHHPCCMSPSLPSHHQSRRECHPSQKEEVNSQRFKSPHYDQASQHHRRGQSSLHSLSRSRESAHFQENIPSVSTPVQLSTRELQCSPKNHHMKQDDDERANFTPSNSSFKGLHRYSTQNISPHTSKSATILPVQCGPCSAPPGVFRYSKSPFAHCDTYKERLGLDKASDYCRKEAPVINSGSSQSVDSGFCEKYTMKQAQDSRSDSRFGERIPPDEAVNVPALRSGDGIHRGIMDHRPEEDTKPTSRSNKYACSKSQYANSPSLYRTKKLDKLEEDSRILSSNLRGRQHKLNQQGNSRQIQTLDENQDDAKTKRETGKRISFTNLSVSSTDTFMTCEEMLSPDTDCDSKSDPKLQCESVHQGLKFQSRQVASHTEQPQRSQCEDLSTFHFGKDAETTWRRQSQGFDVSRLDETKWSPSSLVGKTDSEIGTFLRKDQLADKKNAHPQLMEQPFEYESRARFTVGEHAKGHAALPAPPSNVRNSLANAKLWHPPLHSVPDDSDLITSDDSFMLRPADQHKDSASSLKSNQVSNWLEKLPAQGPKSKDVTVRSGKSYKRTSDESLISVSSVQEYIYRDKESGIALIERHIPSNYSGSSGQPSLESSVSLDTDGTVSYDWSDFTINNDHSSSSSPSFDITAGQTMNSQQSLKSDPHSSCDEGSLLGDEINDVDHSTDETDDTAWQEQECEKDSNRTKEMKPKMQPNKNNARKDSSCKGNECIEKQLGTSGAVSITPELAALSNKAIYQSLKDLGEEPGPVLPSTRQTYLQLLASVQNGLQRVVLSSSQPGYSSELNRLISGSLDMEELAKAELLMVAQFQTPDGRTWREGTIKSCFNYLLMDPRVTKNLPLRAKTLSDMEAFKTFLSAIFYIGKGKRSRPYCHLYEAISQQKSPKPKVSKKVQQILDIWSSGLGVVSLHCFQNVIPVEAYTREACMVDAIGLGRLTNVKRGDYYGLASTWPTTRRCCMGSYLLRKAYQIFLSEGERQICPLDIQRRP